MKKRHLRRASGVVGATGGFAGLGPLVSTAGSVSGLSAAGMTSGLAALGLGSMALGIGVVAAIPLGAYIVFDRVGEKAFSD